ncbi:MAG: ABC transporter ATP-binding protein [Chloroflexi bacterium]|nr:ABC transporter ATP-binding protein [Chloroflexota bacterium]
MHKLEFKGVTKTFTTRNRSIAVLDSFDLQIQRGEFVCLLGPSGCGKTTLLHLIAGLEKPTQGAVLVDGEPVQKISRERVMIFQDLALFPWLNVLGNVVFGLQMTGMSKPERRQIARRYLQLVHLAEFERTNLHELSGGMKQRVALARALAVNPDVLLMDEPFAALDAQTRDLLHAELQNIWKETGKTIVFVTHNVREAIVLGDRVVVLSARPGRIKRDVAIDLPRPRQIENYAVVDLARGILDLMREDIVTTEFEVAERVPQVGRDVL